MNFSTLLGQYRSIAVLEGISYLLLAITVPVKYLLDMGTPNKIVGMIHGVLFIGFVIYTMVLHNDRKWGTRMTLVCLVCSILPFGTFWLDKNFLQKLERNS